MDYSAGSGNQQSVAGSLTDDRQEDTERAITAGIYIAKYSRHTAEYKGYTCTR
jgi:hypothetical protein